jgi:hypothetical protein
LVDSKREGRIVAGYRRVVLGRFAVVWIIIILVFSCYGIYRVWETIDDLVSHGDPRWVYPLTWMLPLSIGVGVLGMAGLSVLLTRRRWGLYVYLASVAINIFLNFYVGGIQTALLGLIGPAILLAAVKLPPGEKFFG